MRTKIQNSRVHAFVRQFGLLLVVSGLMVHFEAKAVGHWVPLAHRAPGAVDRMLLLSDGTVMAQNNGGNNWYRLTNDVHGSYANGDWSPLNSIRPMSDTRQYYSAAVLRDGRVFVAGGEYGSGGAKAEIYDPLAIGGGAWTPTPLSGEGFGDSSSMILPNGNVLVAPVGYLNVGDTLIYNPTSNSWAPGPTTVNSQYQDEASWVKLPDDSILTIDPFNDNFGRISERYIPSLNIWIPDAPVPVSLYSAGSTEIGAGILLTNGHVFFLGGTGRTALYTPTGNTNQGAWVEGPEIPGGLVTQDAPAAMMINGKVLCLVTPAGDHTLKFFYEYDPVANAFTPTSSPQSSTIGSVDKSVISDATCMLDLPDGTVLYSHFGSDLYVYVPEGPPVVSGKPTIHSITLNGDGSYHLAGTQLNGISEGAAQGDDAQMDSNYPLVRLTDSGGNVYYGRTYNWSSTSVQTGNRPVTTEFTLPPVLQNPGNYSLVVVANGIASDPVSFSGPVWVAFGISDPGIGTYDRPYNTLARGRDGVPAGGTIRIKPGSTSETITINKSMTITAIGGSATIGR